jgi:hypothetical protein
MLLKRIYTSSSLTQLFAQINEEVMFKGIAIRISGVAGSTPPAVGDVGRIQYIKKGITMIDCGFDSILSFNDLMSGAPNNESTASGVVDFFGYIPRRYLDDNVETVVPADNAQLKCTFTSNLASYIASGGLVEVYLDLDYGVQKYDLVMRQYSDSVSGASNRPFAIDQPNIIFAGLSATVSSVLTLTGSNISSITGSIGGQSLDVSIGALMDNTSFQFNVENLAGTVSLLPYTLMAALYTASGDITSRLFDNLAVTVTTSGASSPELLVVSALFNKDRYEQTVNKQRARVLDVTQSKAQKGDAQTIETLKKIANVSAVTS